MKLFKNKQKSLSNTNNHTDTSSTLLDTDQKCTTLVMPKKIRDKVSYLLAEFPDEEWSGCAWYKVYSRYETTMPKTVKLVHFVPIDLGTSTSTEIDGDKMLDVMSSMHKKMDLTGLYLGLIHSHHTMGAFFSETDKETALENAVKDGLYFSTVVASQQQRVAFGYSYLDQFCIPRFIEGQYKPTGTNIKVDDEWVQEAKAIKKAKPKPTVWSGYDYNRGYNAYNYYERDTPVNQGNLFTTMKNKTLK